MEEPQSHPTIDTVTKFLATATRMYTSEDFEFLGGEPTSYGINFDWDPDSDYSGVSGSLSRYFKTKEERDSFHNLMLELSKNEKN